MNAQTIAIITGEMARARHKHGADSLENLPDIGNASWEMLYHLHLAGKEARRLCDIGPASRLAVLVEEVAEVADDLLMDRDPGTELVQVAAVACTWREAT